MNQQVDIGRPRLSPEQVALGRKYNELREGHVGAEREIERLNAVIQVLQDEHTSELRDCDDRISKLEADNNTLNQILDDRDRRIAELEERVSREQAKNTRMVTTFDGVETLIGQMKGEVHADDIQIGLLPRRQPMRDTREPDFAALEAAMNADRPPHPALKDAPYGQVVEDIAASVEREKA